MKQLALALALTGSCVLATSLSSTPAFALETYEAKMEAERRRVAGARRHDRCVRPEMPEARAICVARRAGRRRAGTRRHQPLRPARLSLSRRHADGRRDHFDAARTASRHADRHLLGPRQAADVPVEEIRQCADAVRRSSSTSTASRCMPATIPGRPASHGCIRLPVAFAKKLYGVTGVGTPVYIGA